MVLKCAGKYTRGFRSKLATKWLKDAKGNIRRKPPRKYRKLIKLEDWTKFVERVTNDPKFVRASNENRQRAKKPLYPYKRGVMGYSDIEANLLTSAGKDPTVESLGRHVLWVEGRQDKNGVVDNPNSLEVAQKIEAILESVSQGETEDCHGQQDTLARALPTKEYPGRLRGVGFGVTASDIFGSESCTKQKIEERYEKEFARLRQEMRGFREFQHRMQQANQIELRADIAHTPDTARGSCTNFPLEGIHDCDLYLSAPVHRLVAKGFVYSDSGVMLHNLPLPLNHVKVRITIAIEGSAPLPVPNPQAELMIVEQAISTFVAWPMDLVVVSEKGKSNEDKSKGNVSEKIGSRNVSKSHHSSIPIGSTTNRRPPTVSLKYLPYLRMHALTMMNDGHSVYAQMDKEILGFDATVVLRDTDLKEVYNHEWIGSNIVKAYQRYLYHEILIPQERTQRFVFLCPESTCMLRAASHKDEMKTYIVSRFSLAKKGHDTLFLSPVNLGDHWMLLAIDVNQDTVYYLDSMPGGLSKRKELMNLYNSALATHRGLNMTTMNRKLTISTKWIRIKCPHQKNLIDCGYYVMKFLKDIVMQNQMQIPEDYFPECRFESYSVHQLAELKEEWCHHIASFIHQRWSGEN